MRKAALSALFISVVAVFILYLVLGHHAVCSLPMIPAGCTWVSAASPLSPCAGYISCPGVHGANSSSNSTGKRIQEFNYFNLTGAGYINSTTGKLVRFKMVNNVSEVTVSINRTSAAPGDYVLLNVTFHGTFDWTSDPASIYYLGSNVINIHYFGIELQNQTGSLLDQNNGPWSDYVSQIGQPHQVLTQTPNATLPVLWVITPTNSTVGETLKLCGGYFAAYMNSTVHGNWPNAYNNFSMQQEKVLNLSIINIPSQNCEYLKVV